MPPLNQSLWTFDRPNGFVRAKVADSLSFADGCVIVPGTEGRVEKYGIDEKTSIPEENHACLRYCRRHDPRHGKAPRGLSSRR
jgi:hypothetical protein